jgi:hypothetical protein
MADQVSGQRPPQPADSGKKPDSPASGPRPYFAPPKDDKVVPDRPVNQIPEGVLGSADWCWDDLDNIGDDDGETGFTPEPPQGRSSGVSGGEGLPTGPKLLEHFPEFDARKEGHEDASGEWDDELLEFSDQDDDLLSPSAGPARQAGSPPSPAKWSAHPVPAVPGLVALSAHAPEPSAPPTALGSAKAADDTKTSHGEEEEEEEENTWPALENSDDLLPVGDMSSDREAAAEGDERGEFFVGRPPAPSARRRGQVGEKEDALDDANRFISPVVSQPPAMPLALGLSEDSSDLDLQFEILDSEYDDDGPWLVPQPLPQQVTIPPDDVTGKQANGRPAGPAAPASGEIQNDFIVDDPLVPFADDWDAPVGSDASAAPHEDVDGKEEDTSDLWLLD